MNHRIKGGWLEFLGHVRLSEDEDFDEGRDLATRNTAAADAVIVKAADHEVAALPSSGADAAGYDEEEPTKAAGAATGSRGIFWTCSHHKATWYSSPRDLQASIRQTMLSSSR